MPTSQRHGENRKKKRRLHKFWSLVHTREMYSYRLWEMYIMIRVVHTLKVKWEGLLPCIKYLLVACGFSASLCTSVFLHLLTAPSAIPSFLASSTLVGNFSPHCRVFSVQRSRRGKWAFPAHFLASDPVGRMVLNPGPTSSIIHHVATFGRAGGVESPGDLLEKLYLEEKVENVSS